MRKFIVGAAFAALAAGPTLAAQQNAAPQRPAGPPALTRGEIQARVQQRFAAIDRNRDGAITRAELDARRDEARKGRQANRRAQRDKAFAMLDTDRDGAISPQEFAAGHGNRAHGPRGHRGGRPGINGMGGAFALRGGMGPRWIERADADRDGKVTLAEASARPLAAFDRVDTDRNGVVTPEERRAARAGWPARRG